jgi:hypothetical protein
VWILVILGTVALGVIGWCGHHVRRECIRRRQVDHVRATVGGRVSVAELRDRHAAESLPRYPAPSSAVGSTAKHAA